MPLFSVRLLSGPFLRRGYNLSDTAMPVTNCHLGTLHPYTLEPGYTLSDTSIPVTVPVAILGTPCPPAFRLRGILEPQFTISYTAPNPGSTFQCSEHTPPWAIQIPCPDVETQVLASLLSP